VDDARTHDMRTEGEPERDVANGDDIGGYIVDGELGTGGMGVVYSATHPVIGKRAAIKVLRAELSHDPDSVNRFVREAKVVNQIHHPNIVDIFSIGMLPSGQHYMIMDLLDGETLRVRLRRGTPTLAEAASVLDEIASALIAAHDQGIIHRDLKPDNVFLCASPGRWPAVKLLDFGVAKLVRPSPSTPASLATQTGIALGTPWYMSPEQARAKNVDHRTDIYALGVMAYEVLTGVRPFHVLADGGTLVDTASGAPPDLVTVIEQMISEEAESRPTLAIVRAAIKRTRRTLRTDEIVGPATSSAGMDAARTIVDRMPAAELDLATRQTPAGSMRVTIPPEVEIDADELGPASELDDGATTRRPPMPAYVAAPTTIGVPPPPKARASSTPAGGAPALLAPAALPATIATLPREVALRSPKVALGYAATEPAGLAAGSLANPPAGTAPGPDPAKQRSRTQVVRTRGHAWLAVVFALAVLAGAAVYYALP
jgi:serine/threonine-protein kinase